MKLLAFAASLRDGSSNQKLIEVAVNIARKQGVEVTLVPYSELVSPNYGENGNHDEFPESIERLKALFEDHDGFLLASPEYNYSIPGSLKNSLDWVSRYSPAPTAGKFGYLLSASPSMVGGNRGLWSTRIPLEVMGAILYPSMFSLASSYEAFNEDGSLKNSGAHERLEGELGKFIEMVTKQVS